MRIALAQINPLVGDLKGNARKVIEALERAARAGAELAVLPEMVMTGYPPEDLLVRAHFVRGNRDALRQVAAATARMPGLTGVVGFVDSRGRDLFNAAALVRDGRVAAVYHKQLLPNYGVFDERRYFRPGTRPPLFLIGGKLVAVTICEDLWVRGGATERQLGEARPGLVLNLSSSPYEMGKGEKRERMFAGVARACRAPLVFVNQVCGQDELVFDGRSAAFDARGRVVARCASFEEDFAVVDVPVPEARKAGKAVVVSRRSVPPRPMHTKAVLRRPPEALEEVYRALVLGVRDYALKNGFRGAVIGLSGGVDSALTALIAADALGPRNVCGVSMASVYTARMSVDDARSMARKIGIRWMELPIKGAYAALARTLGGHLRGEEAQLARENLQARIRGILLMALSNRYGWLLIATGNKSEMSVGYATLYGDMAGGFAVLKDVPKTLVYRLARWRNRRDGPSRPVPERVFTRPPTAELKPNQRDSDSLPPYPVLDAILQAYIEGERPPAEIVRMGHRPAVVGRVIGMVERAEYKRRQAPPGVKIRPRAFGKDRRMPITHGFVLGGGGKRP